MPDPEELPSPRGLDIGIGDRLAEGAARWIEEDPLIRARAAVRHNMSAGAMAPPTIVAAVVDASPLFPGEPIYRADLMVSFYFENDTPELAAEAMETMALLSARLSDQDGMINFMAEAMDVTISGFDLPTTSLVAEERSHIRTIQLPVVFG